jgi:hypothetical protein
MLAKLRMQYSSRHRKLPHSRPLQTAGPDQPLKTMGSASAVRAPFNRYLLSRYRPDAHCGAQQRGGVGEVCPGN